MDKALRQKIVNDWTGDLPFEKKIIRLFEKVRDIRFGSIGSRNPEDVYRANKGTCSGKNLLLKELYKEIGVQTKDMICLQRWKDITWFPNDRYGIVKFPDELIHILKEVEVVDFHNYVKILVNNKWITVDVTIDIPLRKIGFYTTEQWDGKSDMPLCFVGTHKVWDCGNRGLEEKDRLTKMLPQEMQNQRTLFLKKLTEWIDNLRVTGKI